MDLRSSTRSTRSKSRTPFAMFESEEVHHEQKYSAVVYSENIQTSSTIVRSSNGNSSIERLREEQSSKNTSTKPPSNRRSKRFSNLYKTSDYSSEDGENEVSSSRSITENEKNRILEDARKSADSSTGITALGLYRRAKQYWEEYPKTDYTYSTLSKDRVEIAPGVIAMPNMSRRHLPSYLDKCTNTDNSRYSNSFMRTRKLTETNTFFGSVKRTILRVISTILSVVYLFLKPVFYVYRFMHSVCIMLARGIYLGTSAVMLFDTWLLRSNRSYGKAAALTALCLIPFLLIGGWWLSVSTRKGDWKSMTNSFSSDEYKQESVISFENVKRDEHSNNNTPGYVLTDKQLEDILQYVKKNLDLNNKIDVQHLTQNILQTETIRNILNEQKINQKTPENMEDLIGNQQKSIDELTNEMRQLKLEINNLKQNQEHRDKETLKIQSDSSHKMDYFLYRLNTCCRKAVDLEAHMLKTFVTALNNPEFLKNQKGLTNWLSSLFVARNELENRISQLSESLNSKFDSLSENNSKFLMDQVASRLNFEFNRKFGGSEGANISEINVKQIVLDTLKIYDADKTGLVDYAMEPMGGQIITTRCTETYHAGTAVVSIWGLPLWYQSATPRKVITPGINPGNCWAFQNFPGLLVIKLMVPIKVEAFSYEHVSKLLVPDGNIDSAPRDIEVYGLEDENDRNGIRLGNFRYDYNGESLQFFPSDNNDLVFHYIELKVISNHGNPSYTCLYRFRVHGKKMS